ncbi:MAG: hypothetical protein HYZ28_14080 [Myxococcales bacterium]|nr:hypothetical protein [Myxococcales bacterium]
MNPTRFAILAVGVSIFFGCGQPADSFEGEWEVSGADWFSTGSSEVSMVRGPARATRALPQPATLPTEVEGSRESKYESSWVVPSVGRRVVARGVNSDLLIRLSQCEVPADVESGVGRIPVGFVCSQRMGAGVVVRTFTSGSLTPSRDGLTLTAGGMFSELLNGRVYTGTFAINETLARKY